MHAFRPLVSRIFVQNASSLRFVGKIISFPLRMFTLVAAQVISKSEGGEQMGVFSPFMGAIPLQVSLHTVEVC